MNFLKLPIGATTATMAKKRRAPNNEESGPNLDIGESRKRIRTFEDVADSDDEFHKDRLLLEDEPDVKRRRRLAEREAFLEPSDDEVLGVSEPEEDDEEEEVEIEAAQRKLSGRNGATSDSEGSEDEAEDDELQWGTTRDDLYGADAIETEEQALEEEAEALRLQKKQLQSMTAADYGFDESEWQGSGEADRKSAEQAAVVTEILPQLQIADDLGPVERLKLLKSRYPEFEPLSKELLHLRDVVAELGDKANASSPGSMPNTYTKYCAACAYAGTLTMYFSLLTSTAWNGQTGVTALSASKLRDHPVMVTLVQCKELWQRAKDLPGDDKIHDSDDGSAQLANGVDGVAILEPTDLSREKPAKKTRAHLRADAAQVAHKARKAERIKQAEADLADLDDLLLPADDDNTKSSTLTSQSVAVLANDDSDIGEEAPLTAHEAAEKAKRKKSLRFYTSQIVQKSNKRGASGRNAGGDEDIPHRERLRDRQARLNAEAEKRGKRPTAPAADLGGDSDDEDAQQAKQIRADVEDDDYYDLVAARTNKKKSDKAALADAQKQAALQGGEVVPQEVVGADGKRKITYLIEKNKGLTPHRKKDVRNPRVKKRKKYDEKKKKLASMKPIYKGGEGRGGYGGELTGIKKGLVKSTKLS